MLNSESTGSINNRLALTGLSSFFFQPLQIHFEAANLFVKCYFLGGKVLLSPTRFCLKYPAAVGQEFLLPLADLCWMNFKVAGDLVASLLIFRRFQRHLEFEFCRVLLPFCH